MSDHIQVTFTDIQPEQQEWIIAHLAEAEYDGFEEGSLELKAFIPQENFDKYYLKELAFKYQLAYEESIIAERNWNAVWESAFHPVVVDDFAAIRADFHPPISDVIHEIVITPKMSFGTGHHATTFMMIRGMRKIDFENKSVFDFGTGTGVLAILAEKSGASEVVAADNDNWSIVNATENFERNHCNKIQLVETGEPPVAKKFDVILANINKNVLTENMHLLSGSLKPGGVLLLSGIMMDDEDDLIASAGAALLVFAGKQMKDNWLCLQFVR